MRNLGFHLLATSLGVTTFPLANSGLAQDKTGEEQILGAEVNPHGIAFRVKSGGCTSKTNFGLETLNHRPLTVRLLRIRPDHCEAQIPDGTNVDFSFAEIGAGPALSDQARKDLVIVNAQP